MPCYLPGLFIYLFIRAPLWTCWKEGRPRPLARPLVHPPVTTASKVSIRYECCLCASLCTNVAALWLPIYCMCLCGRQFSPWPFIFCKSHCFQTDCMMCQRNFPYSALSSHACGVVDTVLWVCAYMPMCVWVCVCASAAEGWNNTTGRRRDSLKVECSSIRLHVGCQHEGLGQELRGGGRGAVELLTGMWLTYMWLACDFCMKVSKPSHWDANEWSSPPSHALCW